MDGLDESIQTGLQVVGAMPDDDPNLAEFLYALADLFHDRYCVTGSTVDLEEAIKLGRLSVSITPANDPNRPRRLGNLGVYIEDKYPNTKDLADLDEAIEIGRQVVDSTQEHDPSLAMRLHNLATRCSNRYAKIGVLADLEEAIRLLRRSLLAMPKDDQEWVRWLNNLGIRLDDRYVKTGDMGNLEESIEIGRQAVRATAEGHPDRPALLINLGNRLDKRYSKTGTMADIEEAIQVGRQAVNNTPEDHSYRAMCLSTHANRLGDRYANTGAMEDLEEAIELGRQSVRAASEDHQVRAMCLNGIAIRLGDRYLRTGAISDLEEAINIGREALRATPENDPNLAVYLNSLAVRLGERYSATGAILDLEEAIETGWQSTRVAPEDHPNRAAWLNNLGLHLRDKFTRTRDMTDLNDAIEVGRQSIRSVSKDHPDRIFCLNSLQIGLSARYAETKTMADLEEAMDLSQQVVNGTPEGHRNRPLYINNLGSSFHRRYSKTKAIEDLNESIKIGRQAVAVTPEDDPNQALCLNNLASRLAERSLITGSKADLAEAGQYYSVAIHLQISPTRDRIIAGRQLLGSSDVLGDIQEAYRSAETVVQLIPLLASRVQQNTDKQYNLTLASRLASDATAITLKAGKGSAAAIQMLETGRGILTGDIFDLRTDISALQEHYPDLAGLFIKLRDKLDAPALGNNTLTTLKNSVITPQEEANQRREASKQLEALLKRVRDKPGFERFLLPPAEDELRSAAMNGPIAIINVSKHGCDALIITPLDIQAVKLPRLSRAELERRDCQSLDTLVWLWDTVVHPVLDALGFTETPFDSRWPCVWWIPTGPLVRFPLHAAGDHRGQRSATALDRVISSYSPSVKAIIHGRRRRANRRSEPGRNAMLVAMKNTPNQPTLRFADEEIVAMRAICESMHLNPIQPEQSKKEVLSALQTCWIFHFAGHGRMNFTSPLHSELLLRDWAEDALTVESLLTTNLSSEPPFLAYLSACGTSENRNEELADEVIHLAAACQLAGFRHVIGTLWSVDDKLCVRMATSTYKTLKDEVISDGQISDGAVSRGLHHATRELRDDWLREVDVGIDKGSQGMARSERRAQLHRSVVAKPPYWIPYVHYGV
ncbi:CHAT domain-containing protein [Xylaria sp. CBS 124048]|nr:CHAT domain-containing protein [Xylaria sp. CBS 124048]